MNAIDLILRRAPVPVVALGVAALGAGVVLQMQGVALPHMLGSVTSFGVMAKIGGAAVIAGLLLFMICELRGATPASVTVAQAAVPVAASAAPDDPPPASVPGRVADWQRRLAEKTAAPIAGEPAAPRSRIGARLHRGALALVGVAFVGLLGLTIWNQVASSLMAAAEPPAPAPITVEDLAFTVADAMIADAPADRHWTQFDLAPVIEWFTAKAALAMLGDRTAMLQLGMIVGGVMFSIVGLYVFLVLRRINGSRRRYADVGSMGYN